MMNTPERTDLRLCGRYGLMDARAFASPKRLRPRRRVKPGHDAECVARDITPSLGYSTVAASLRNDPRGFDLEPPFRLEQPADLHQRHCREIVAQHLAIGFAELAAAIHVLIHVEDVPG